MLKDFLRELPEPVFTNVIFHMLLDALNVRLPEDPAGSAKLMLSVLECLPKPNQVSHRVNYSNGISCLDLLEYATFKIDIAACIPYFVSNRFKYHFMKNKVF